VSISDLYGRRLDQYQLRLAAQCERAANYSWRGLWLSGIRIPARSARQSNSGTARKSRWKLGGRLRIIAVMAMAPDYYVFTIQTDERPHGWRWELRRHCRPMGVRLGDGGFRSQAAAEFAGNRALEQFLVQLAKLERRRR
jgi:hypothetical protein